MPALPDCAIFSLQVEEKGEELLALEDSILDIYCVTLSQYDL